MFGVGSKAGKCLVVEFALGMEGKERLKDGLLASKFSSYNLAYSTAPEIVVGLKARKNGLMLDFNPPIKLSKR